MKAWIGACALLMAVGAAGAQDRASPGDYRAQVRTYLTDQSAKHAADGFRADNSVPDLVRGLRLEGGHLWSVPLRAGVTYRVFVVCDNDCSDVDLELFDPAGDYVGRDVAVNDTPYVEVTPARDGAYHARIWLAACEHEPCYVGGRVFRK